jgi:hypothetical protein
MGRLATFEQLPRDQQPFLTHPSFWRKSNVPHKDMMEITRTAMKLGTDLIDSVTAAQGKSVKTLGLGIRGQENPPCMTEINDSHNKKDH